MDSTRQVTGQDPTKLTKMHDAHHREGCLSWRAAGFLLVFFPNVPCTARIDCLGTFKNTLEEPVSIKTRPFSSASHPHPGLPIYGQSTANRCNAHWTALPRLQGRHGISVLHERLINESDLEAATSARSVSDVRLDTLLPAPPMIGKHSPVFLLPCSIPDPKPTNRSFFAWPFVSQATESVIWTSWCLFSLD